MILARLKQFEPFQVFNFLDRRNTGTLEAGDLENFMLKGNNYLTRKDLGYLVKLNAYSANKMTYDAFLKTVLPQNDQFMK